MLAWDGTTLRPLIDDWGMGDAMFFEGKRVYFPSHLQGEPGVIHEYEEIRKSLGEDKDPETMVVPVRYEYRKHSVYRWDGQQLREIRSEVLVARQEPGD